MPLRYVVADVDDNCVVRLEEREDYIPVRRALNLCKKLVDEGLVSEDPDGIFRIEFIERLKGIMRECGQACP